MGMSTILKEMTEAALTVPLFTMTANSARLILPTGHAISVDLNTS